MTPRASGFTVLEVLAATVVLGVLAVAVVPLTRHLITDQGRVRDGLAARMALSQVDLATISTSGLPVPMTDHAGWWIRAEPLSSQIPPVIPGQPSVLPAYYWARMVIATGPLPSASALAERIVLIRAVP